MQHTFFLISKINFARFFDTFLCRRCFARLQRETSRNVLVTHFMEEVLFVFLFTCFSLPVISTLVAASISPFSHHRLKFLFFFQRNWSPLVFISRSTILDKTVEKIVYLGNIFPNIVAVPVLPSPHSPESNVVVYSKESLFHGRL